MRLPVASTMPAGAAALAYLEGTFTYSSSIDASVTGLFGKYSLDAGFTANVPVLCIMHGFAGDANDITTATMRRYASRGVCAVALGMRGRNGATGNPDGSGRELYDILDGATAVRAIGAIAARLDAQRTAFAGYSGGGGNGLGLCCKSPDQFTCLVNYFGIADYGLSSTAGWWFTNPANQPTLTTWIGDRASVTAPYAARDVATSIAGDFRGAGRTFMFADSADSTVAPVNSARVDAAMIAANLDRNSIMQYFESFPSSSFRWNHGLPETSPDLVVAEEITARAMFAPSWTVSPRASGVPIIGYQKTRLYELWLGPTSNPRTTLSGGIDQTATLAYDASAGTYSVVPATPPVWVQIQDSIGRTAMQQIVGPTTLQVT